MKNIKWYLQNIDSKDMEDFLDEEAKTNFSQLIFNERIFAFFKDKSLTESYEFFRQDAIAQFNYLVGLPEHDTDMCVAYSYAEDSAVVQKLENYKKFDLEELQFPFDDDEKSYYSLEGWAVEDLISFKVPEAERSLIFQILHSIFYESWYFWDGSAVRELRGDYESKECADEDKE